MVHSLKMGWMKPRDAKTVDDGSKKFYMLWQTDDQGGFHVRNGIIKSLAMDIVIPGVYLEIHIFAPPPS